MFFSEYNIYFTLPLHYSEFLLFSVPCAAQSKIRDGKDNIEKLASGKV